MILSGERVEDASQHHQPLPEQARERRLGQHGGGQAELRAQQAADERLMVGPTGADLRLKVRQPGRRQHRARVVQRHHLLWTGREGRTVVWSAVVFVVKWAQWQG